MMDMSPSVLEDAYIPGPPETNQVSDWYKNFSAGRYWVRECGFPDITHVGAILMPLLCSAITPRTSSHVSRELTASTSSMWSRTNADKYICCAS